VLLANVLLALAWGALQGELSTRTLTSGLVLGYLILLALVRGGVLPPSRHVGRVHRIVGLAAFFLWELVRANLRLALDVATPSYHITPGIIAVPLDVTTDLEILLLFATLVAIGPLVRPASESAPLPSTRFGLADFPG